METASGAAGEFASYLLSIFNMNCQLSIYQGIMPQPDNLGTFFSENKRLLSEYLETRLALLKLQAISQVSKVAGNLVWALIAIFFAFIILIFGGLVLGFWFSALTGSYIKGFGLATLGFIILFILMTILRKSLFVNPMIRKVISTTGDSEEQHD